MKRAIKISLVAIVLSLSVFSFIYVETSGFSTGIDKEFLGAEINFTDMASGERQNILPESKIIEFLAEQASAIFSSVITSD